LAVVKTSELGSIVKSEILPAIALELEIDCAAFPAVSPDVPTLSIFTFAFSLTKTVPFVIPMALDEFVALERLVKIEFSSKTIFRTLKCDADAFKLKLLVPCRLTVALTAPTSPDELASVVVVLETLITQLVPKPVAPVTALKIGVVGVWVLTS